MNLPLKSYISDKRLLPLADKILRKERLTFDDGLLLYTSSDITGIGAMAHTVRLRIHGKKTYYVVSRRISYTNICYTNCQFCAFRAKQSDPKAYLLSADDIVKEMQKSKNIGVRELHMVAGLHPKIKIEYFEKLFQKLTYSFPNLHLKALSMVEIDYYAKISGISIEDFLDRCIAAGLESCPGGGAEIFDSEVREKICKGKKNAEIWLNVAEICHQKGIPTNCTMLYGHIEEPAHRVDHLLRLRELQDRTDGFLAYIPLAYQTENNELSNNYHINETTGQQDIREIAVGRLMLDNIKHIKAYWVMITEAMAQLGLNYGANDMDGTIIEETIAHDAGAKTPQGISKDRLKKLIEKAGFEPIERDNIYQTYT
jgi:aminodeoxyfutalosine synthase